MRLQGGRLVGTSGVPVEWRAVTLPADLPSWRSIQGPYAYERSRDEMPGYRLGLRERIVLRPVPPVRDSQLRQVPPAALSWFEEAPQGTGLGPARYAVRPGPDGQDQVVYGEQCLSERFCMTWQVWPPGVSAAAGS